MWDIGHGYSECSQVTPLSPPAYAMINGEERLCFFQYKGHIGNSGVWVSHMFPTEQEAEIASKDKANCAKLVDSMEPRDDF
jgi:hypothetical protein